MLCLLYVCICACMHEYQCARVCVARLKKASDPLDSTNFKQVNSPSEYYYCVIITHPTLPGIFYTVCD